MDHPFPNSQGDIDTCGFRSFGKAHRIIEHGFIRADADEYGRQSAQITVKRRYPWPAWIVLFSIFHVLGLSARLWVRRNIPRSIKKCMGSMRTGAATQSASGLSLPTHA